MKLEQIDIDGGTLHRPMLLDGFSPGLTFVYGENRAGKSHLARSIRALVSDSSYVASTGSQRDQTIGRARVKHAGRIYQLQRRSDTNQVVATSHDQPGIALNATELPTSVSAELYDTFYNFSFKATRDNARRMATVLQRQLDVGLGPQAAGDISQQQSGQRELDAWRTQLANVESAIVSLNQTRAELVAAESQQSDYQRKLSALDAQIADLHQRIANLNVQGPHEQLASIEREIQTLRLRIDNARTEVIYPVADPSVDHAPLYAQLDELENQIRRWRHVQTDVQNQRVRLRDEMLAWNALTMDSDQHPYHTAREILVSLESRVDQTERSANHWADVDNGRVDTQQLAATLTQFCQQMRDDLYTLCNELSHQFKHLRHKAAATELKQLRRCYAEMGENIERLVQRRADVIREIQRHDPAGAEAIVRAESQFCQCSQHEGYLEARRRFVGPIAAAAPEPIRIEPDLSHERSRLETLEKDRTTLLSQLSHRDTDLADLNRQLEHLVQQRDALVSRNVSFDHRRLAALDAELTELQAQQHRLTDQINSVGPLATVSPVLSQAAKQLSKCTLGEISFAYLALLPGTQELAIHVQTRSGQVQVFDQLPVDRQDQVYLSLVLAGIEYLKTTRTIELPLVIDDAFCHIADQAVQPTLDLISDYVNRGRQVILLTQHRYLADRMPGGQLLKLAEPAEDKHYRPVAAAVPAAPVVHSVPVTNSIVADQTIGVREQVSQSQYNQNLAPPYPLSKYRRNDEVMIDDVPRIYPVSTGDQNTQFDRSLADRDSRYVAVSVDHFTHPLPVDGALGDRMPLSATGLFESSDLRLLERHGLTIVEDLLSLHEDFAEQIGVDWERVEEWQAQATLMTAILSLRADEARTLAASGITSPQQMASLHARDIFDRIQRLLRSNHDYHHGFVASVDFDRVKYWMDRLEDSRAQWSRRPQRQSGSSGFTPRAYQPRGERSPGDSLGREHSGRSSQPTGRTGRTGRSNDRERRSVAMPPASTRTTRAPRSHRSDRDDNRAVRSSPRSSGRSDRRRPAVAPPLAPVSERALRGGQSRDVAKSISKKEASADSSSRRKLKFYLNLDDNLEAAPSIGPKTAARFEKIGVITVADFLKQTAESMEEKLNYKRINANTLRQWQHQARLNCRVPNLRGHDVQLLVGCDITEPEELATMQPQRLFDRMLPFTESKEGLKIIRNGKKPDLAEITDWITWAGENRSIQAA